MGDDQKKTILGISENLEALIAYAVGWVSGLVFLLLEKDNSFVRFHALQSLVTFLALTIVGAVAVMIPVLGILAAVLLWPLGLVLWIILMIKAYQGEKFKLPKIGDFCEKQLAK
ncbi:MAG: DUF4870 domain-containing protein [Candidatus Omnitrophica bacterium]|nr:DUF4870 domain-containing protein [Candidatus Omnitrophota bacterium]